VLHSRNKIRRAPCVDTHVPSWHVVDYNPRIRAVQRRGIRNLRIVQLEVVVPEALKPVEIAKSVRKTSGWHARFLRYLPPLANVVRTRDAVAESLKSEALLRTHEKLVTWFDVTQDRLAGTMQVSFFQNKKKKETDLEVTAADGRDINWLDKHCVHRAPLQAACRHRLLSQRPNPSRPYPTALYAIFPALGGQRKSSPSTGQAGSARGATGCIRLSLAYDPNRAP